MSAAQAQHTPGPWFATKESRYNEVARIGRAWNIGTALPLASMGHPDRDAYLIAAAPELLAALEAIVKSLADQDDEGVIEHAQQMIDARAAIKSATGGEL